MSTADAADAYLRRHREQRRRLATRLARVNRSIGQWQLWEVNRRLPPALQRRDLREPAVSLAALRDFRAALRRVLADPAA